MMVMFLGLGACAAAGVLKDSNTEQDNNSFASIA
jgi:hypothetical protein